MNKISKPEMMKLLSTFFFCFLTIFAISQNASVERSVAGMQIGWGIWMHYEGRLSDQIALRSEIGVHARLRGFDLYQTAKVVMSPVLTLEPRWYYNLEERLENGKRIDDNSGNFFSLKTSWHPDWFNNDVVNGMDDLTDISFVPTWGIRRLIGEYFTFETGIGAGCRLVFAEYEGTRVNELDGVIHLNVRFGIGFK